MIESRKAVALSGPASRWISRRVRSWGSFEPSGNIERPSWSTISILRPCLVSSIMRCFEISVMSGMFCMA